ncbi:M20/M25/M40 family metallo-hydrolase, partial [Flavobacteriales bacterium]|nr:M20/M25/M40 family metallo-hydrolase [Flavobacteriales bacterium]
MKEQYQIAVELLQKLIQTQSFSSEEHNTAAIIEDWLEDHGVSFNRTQNNIWAVNKYFDENKPTILLNSHHDTVRPNKGYTNDPYDAFIEGDKLYGLGSNDAGGCLVSLLSTF